jgi:hypothetical protein
VHFTIERLEPNHAILRTRDDQTLSVPLAELPDGAEEGGVLDVALGARAAAPDDRTTPAQKILNEILGGT